MRNLSKIAIKADIMGSTETELKASTEIQEKNISPKYPLTWNSELLMIQAPQAESNPNLDLVKVYAYAKFD